LKHDNTATCAQGTLCVSKRAISVFGYFNLTWLEKADACREERDEGVFALARLEWQRLLREDSKRRFAVMPEDEGNRQTAIQERELARFAQSTDVVRIEQREEAGLRSALKQAFRAGV